MLSERGQLVLLCNSMREPKLYLMETGTNSWENLGLKMEMYISFLCTVAKRLSTSQGIQKYTTQKYDPGATKWCPLSGGMQRISCIQRTFLYALLCTCISYTFKTTGRKLAVLICSPSHFPRTSWSNPNYLTTRSLGPSSAKDSAAAWNLLNWNSVLPSCCSL